MKSTIFAVLAITLGLVSGCASTVSQACDRADECNSLSGETVDECVDRNEKALDGFTDAKRADCENAVDKCLENESCENFSSCLGAAFANECR